MNLKNKQKFEEILYPMKDILNKKNIAGVSYVCDGEKLYICFNKEYLSGTNSSILMAISKVYAETLFHSNDNLSPLNDRAIYWCPGEFFDSKEVFNECFSKKYYILELDINDIFTILGTSIMIANSLLEQDPLSLKCNEEKTVYSEEETSRHDHYISNGCQDKSWISLSIFLNKENPLYDNPYASFISLCEINTPVKCDNMIGAVITGYNEKKYIIFDMSKKELIKNIKSYYQIPDDMEFESNVPILNKSLNSNLLT